MKKLFLLLVLLQLLIIGCEKQDIYDQLNGTWKIFSISGSIMGWQTIRDFDLLIFNSSNNYSVFFNNNVIQGGSYKIEKKDSKQSEYSEREFLLVLKESFNIHPIANFYSDHPFDIIFNGGDTLTLLQSGIYDGFNYHFVREK